MLDISVEQIIKTKSPKSAIVFKTIMIIADILAVTTIPSIYAIGLLLTAVLVVFTVLLFRYYDAEYEYSIVENELTIDKIMARSMRRRCGVFSMNKATLVTNPGTQDSLRMEYKKLRVHSYLSNTDSEQKIEIYTMDSHNEMVKLIIEPNGKMLNAIKASVNKNAYKVDNTVEEKLLDNSSENVL